MKPFYSISELAAILNESIYKVADGLAAYDVTPIIGGKPADLSGWTGGNYCKGNNIYIFDGYYDDPDPDKVIVATDRLPESWKKCIVVDDFPAINSEEITTEASNDWRDTARSIADSLDEADAKSGAHDSVKNIADRVANKMRTTGQKGPRGPLSGATVLREALQGGKWKRKNMKG